MTGAVAALGSRSPAALLEAGFRPFFLAAAGWAVVALVLWLAMLLGGLELPSRLPPLAWHAHEMLFGFVLAGVGGFLLTAIPNWTKRPPVAGLPLAVLALLWLAGRVDALVSAELPLAAALALDLAFPLALSATAAHELVAGRHWRNLPLLLPPLVLGAGSLLMQLEAEGFAVPAGIGWRVGLAATLALISVIGGRIIPAFTGNWLAARGIDRRPAGKGIVDRLALGTLHAGLFAWVAFPGAAPVGALLVAAALVNLWRLARWQGLATRPEPLLLVLHLGYLWLALGAGLLGLALLWPALPLAAALHALGAGAAGTMMLAVMTRATRGHTGRPLTADAATIAIYLAITVAALARVAAALLPSQTLPLLWVAGVAWLAAFGGFLAAYGPMLLRPRPR
ncbi:MAG: NnrS family protein [Dongiaceae bacterium]